MARDLSKSEQRAIYRLTDLAKEWPQSLAIFSNSGSLEVHVKPELGSGIDPYTDKTLVETIAGISNDGGDRDAY